MARCYKFPKNSFPNTNKSGLCVLEPSQLCIYRNPTHFDWYIDWHVFLEVHPTVLSLDTMIQPDSQEAITAFVDTIHPNFDYVVGTSAFSSCLLTLLVVLLAFSTKESRRHLVFYLNVLAICLALTFGMLIGVTNGAIILDPFHLVSKDVYITAIAFAAFAPLFYDSILLFRLFLLYPPAITPKATQLKIFAFPFFIKCARIIVMVCFSYDVFATLSYALLPSHFFSTTPRLRQVQQLLFNTP